MKKQNRSVEWLAFIGLFVFFVGISLMLVMMGARAYQKSIEMTTSQFLCQTPVNYMRMKVRQNDRVGGIFISKIEEQTALVLVETLEGIAYETWLYVDEGYLKELYIRQGDHVALADGQTVIPLEAMACHLTATGQLTIQLETLGGKLSEECISLQTMQRGDTW